MAEKPPTVTLQSPKDHRAAFDATRARITAQVDEIEARLRTRVHDSGVLDSARLVNGLKGSAAVAVLAGAVAGFVAVRRIRARRRFARE